MSTDAVTAESTPPIQPTKIVQEFLRYDFSEQELKEKAKALSLALQLKERAESEQKAAQAQFKERIEAQQNIISRVSREIYSGWEMRNIDCRVEFHVPTVASKRITRIDTGELVAERPMNADELQLHMFEDGTRLDEPSPVN